MTDDRRTFMWILLTAGLVVILAALLVNATDDCDKRHGKLVRSVFWFECVAAP